MTACDWICRRVFAAAVCAVGFLAVFPLAAAESGSQVVVVYNTKEPESRKVAEYYAEKRNVPTNQIVGFSLPTTETMTREEFVGGLQRPLLKRLEDAGIFKLSSMPLGSNSPPGAVGRRVVASTIRYAALCYGVPTKIAPDSTLIESMAEKFPLELRRNEAAVDSQLACLPVSELNLPWVGTIPNPFFGATNSQILNSTNGILLVTRLDGPTAAIARGLVDKALEAERDGLWGRAYFDSRGITNGAYKLGDDIIRGAAAVTRNMGFETILDELPDTFPPSFPLSQIAFYAGWYDGNVSGPFLRPQVEFMPGAFAYHLHSFSASTIRSPSDNWVGPLLARGAAATMGCVYEPYLATTPDMTAFFSRFIFFRFSFGEAAYAAQNSLSWQNTVIGDPLYRPFAIDGQKRHEELERRNSSLVEWSHIGIVNLNLNIDPNPAESIQYLEGLPLTRKSAVLTEKLAELYWSKKRLSDALDTYAQVLKLNPSPQQRIRVLLTYAQRRELYGPDSAAFDLYAQFLKENPGYPDLLFVYRKMLPLAQHLNRTADAEHCEMEIKRLTAKS